METTLDNDTQVNRIEEIRNRMKEKRKKAAKLAGMNGSWNKSFSKRPRCPNASVVLKSSLKCNNRALARSLQTLKHENRIAQDMITDLQNEQQVLMHKVYEQRQAEKENMRIRKEIQTALSDVTSSLLMAGNKLAYAMELTTKVPIRESLLRSSSVQTMSSDDESICLKQRQSSLGPSVYYRKSKSAGGLAPVSPVNKAEPSRMSTTPQPKASIICEPPKPVDAVVPMETGIPEPEQDPEDECLDPSMIKDLDFDIPMMFTDDDVTGKIDMAQSDDEDGHSIKRRTRSSRTSGIFDKTAASRNRSTSSRRTSSRMNPVKSHMVNSQSRVTVVVAQEIKEDEETSQDQLPLEEKKAEQPSNVLNQTLEIEDNTTEKSSSCEKSVPGEKTSFNVEDMELTGPCANQKSRKEPNDEPPTVDETCPVEKAKEANSKKSDSNVSKKKSKLPLKKAKTKVTLKKKDRQETFQSPKSPLMSPGMTRSTNGLSFRCVPSPVCDRSSKKKPVPSKSTGNNRHDTSLTSAFDLSEGDTFSDAKSVIVPPGHETILECSDKVDSPVDKDETNKELKPTDLVDLAESHPGGVKSIKTKMAKKKQKPSNPKVEKKREEKEEAEKPSDVLNKTFEIEEKTTEKSDGIEKSNATGAPSNTKDTVDDSGDGGAAGQDDERKPKEDAPVAAKTKRSKKSKSVTSASREDTKTQHQEPNDKDETKHQKKKGKKKSAYFPFEEEETEAASSFFITKPMIHKKRKDSKNNESGLQENGDKANLSLFLDFMQDINSVINSVQNLKEDNGKRKKKRLSIPVLIQNKSVMASRLDAAMIPLEKSLQSQLDVKQPKQENKMADGEGDIAQQKPSGTTCQINKPMQGNDKVDEWCVVDDQEKCSESKTGQSENRQEGQTRSRKSRMSSVSPVIQPSKGRSRKCVITGDDENKPKQGDDKVAEQCVTDEQKKDSGSQTGPGQSENNQEGQIRSRRSRMSSVSPVIQPTKGRKQKCILESDSESEDGDEDYKPTSKTRKSSVVGRRKGRVSINVEGIDEASESDTGRQRHKKPRKDQRKTASKTKNQDLITIEEKESAKADENDKLRSTKGKTENEGNADAKVVEKRQLKNCIKMRSSIAEKKQTDKDSTSTENTAVKTEAEQKISLGGRRTSRRAASSVNYKEPSIGGKLRRGDAFTSNDYLEEKDIYKGSNDVKKGMKKNNAKNRKPLSNVQNTIVPEEISCESS